MDEKMRERSDVIRAQKVAGVQKKEKGLGSGDVKAVVDFMNLRARLDKFKDTLGRSVSFEQTLDIGSFRTSSLPFRSHPAVQSRKQSKKNHDYFVGFQY